MEDILNQRNEFHTQLTSLQNEYEQNQQENKALKEEVYIYLISIFLWFFFDRLNQKMI